MTDELHDRDEAHAGVQQGRGAGVSEPLRQIGALASTLDLWHRHTRIHRQRFLSVTSLLAGQISTENFSRRSRGSPMLPSSSSPSIGRASGQSMTTSSRARSRDGSTDSRALPTFEVTGANGRGDDSVRDVALQAIGVTGTDGRHGGVRWRRRCVADDRSRWLPIVVMWRADIDAAYCRRWRRGRSRWCRCRWW
jgi:hypothetical protein